jgi:hypothetical protein
MRNFLTIRAANYILITDSLPFSQLVSNATTDLMYEYSKLSENTAGCICTIFEVICAKFRKVCYIYLTLTDNIQKVSHMRYS